MHLGAVETFLLDLQLSLVCFGARSYVVTSFAYAFPCTRFVFLRSPACVVLVSVRSGSRPSASTKRNQLLDGLISLSPLYPRMTNGARQYRYESPSEFPLTLPFYRVLYFGLNPFVQAVC